MNRFDFKFLLKSSEAIAFLNHLYREFDLIANNEIMIRSYETKYFDTYQRDTFLMHHKGKFPRYKIRTRTYLDTNDQFVEVKFKNNKETTAEINRTKKIIENCLIKSKGPFMFKKFSIADAMYAPVMFRFKIYNIKLSFILEKYLNTLLNMKEIKLWLLEARKELK
ncbi:MAG: VTC domain-containing protein [Proteobacteria bacterium]|nr:VTC domain-containing protein [Candidatus Fonsibacter lacus]